MIFYVVCDAANPPPTYGQWEADPNGRGYIRTIRQNNADYGLYLAIHSAVNTGLAYGGKARVSVYQYGVRKPIYTWEETADEPVA